MTSNEPFGSERFSVTSCIHNAAQPCPPLFGSKTVSSPQNKAPHPGSSSSSATYLTSAPGNHLSAFCSQIYLLWIFRTKGVRQHGTFRGRLLSLGVRFARSTHSIACIRAPSFVLLNCMNGLHFLMHSSIDELLSLSVYYE